MVDVPLKFKLISEREPLDSHRYDYVVGESGGVALFPDDKWYYLWELWENQKLYQKDRQYKIGFEEMARNIEFMWLVGWLERSHYAL